MSIRDLTDLILLAALWGASFLLMRVAAPEFGPVALIATRVAIAALFLAPLLIRRGQLPALRAHWRPIAVLGFLVSALPFTLFAYALLSITASLGSILNAATPMFAAIVAYVWFKDSLSPGKIAGLVIGFFGVVVLVWDGALFRSEGGALAVAAALASTLCYGIGANYTRVRLAGVNPLVVATGSQLAATVMLSPLAAWRWPAELPGAAAWLSAALLGVACTGIAFVIFFRLLANVGAARATAVTYLIPVFGMLWGAIFLSEAVTVRMITGCAVVLAGIALTSGALTPAGLVRVAAAFQRSR